jgi:Fur family zinc uptake transcriptional regulator|tara:strand:+ start:1056 stop:1487 length:432 start_codon:yes stop_codon:yes gene_type:complete
VKNAPKDIALQRCIDTKTSLTPNRLLIFQSVCENAEPITAYGLQKKLQQAGRKLNIASIYRVIEFWCEQGLIHKITSLNKYQACKDPDEIHTHIINVCSFCESVFETCNERMGLDLKRGSAEIGMLMAENSHVEIPIICVECQ